MTIRDKDKFMGSLWDWGFLRTPPDCFPGTSSRYGMTDLDGINERNGRFIIIEAKGMNASVQIGQAITFNALKATGLFEVLVLYGEPNKPERMQIWPHKPIAATEADVKDFVRAWFQWADSLKK